MSDVNCPYCNAEIEINHDDGYGYEEDKIYNQQCCECNKTFAYTTQISFYHEAQKADCLNDAEHKFAVTNTYPRVACRMICNDCGKERDLTAEERKIHNVPTFAEYEAEMNTRIRQKQADAQIGEQGE